MKLNAFVFTAFAFVFYAGNSFGQCLAHPVPASNAGQDQQSEFLKDIAFQTNFATCTKDELARIETLLSDDITSVASSYDSDNKMNKLSAMAIAANFKSTLALVRLEASKRN